LLKIYKVLLYLSDRGGTVVMLLCYKSEEAGSNPVCVNEFFFDKNTYVRTMALGSIQPLTEMSTRNIS
jgi:hypothetical protein